MIFKIGTIDMLETLHATNLLTDAVAANEHLELSNALLLSVLTNGEFKRP